MSDALAGPPTWRSLLADGEYRTLWAAQAISTVGDQLARVALTVLVFDRTKNTFLTATVIGITFLPWVIGGPLLGGMADRFRRRSIMIMTNVLSAVLIGMLAIPGLPLVALCSLLFLAVLLEPLFAAARAALLADILPDDRYVLANALGNLTTQTGGVVGFAVGGVLVTLVGPRRALLIDAATFLLSAVMLRLWVRQRAVASTRSGEISALADWGARIKDGARLVFRDPKLRTLVIMAWLATFYVVPEGLAAPFVAELHGGPVAVGLVLAAESAGTVIAGLVLSRLIPPARRLPLMMPLAALSLAPLVLIAFRPGLTVSIALFVLVGVGASFQLVANATFVQAVPADRRGQAFGLATAGLIAGQGLGIFAAGAVAQAVGPVPVIAGAGVLGLLTLATISGVGRRVLTSAPSPAVR